MPAFLFGTSRPSTPRPCSISSQRSSAAYFTDSGIPFIFRVDRDTLAVTAIPLTGGIVSTVGFNANGIEATANGDTLVLVQSNTGKLFTVDPVTGVTDEIELAGGDAAFGDGLLLVGRKLYVVQTFPNLVERIDLAPDWPPVWWCHKAATLASTCPLRSPGSATASMWSRPASPLPPAPDTTYDVVNFTRP